MNETQDITDTGEFRLLESIIEVGKKLNPYVEAVCIGKPIDLPEYEEQAEQWKVWFEESETPYHPYDKALRENINFPDLISYSCDSADEACELYNYYNQNPVKEDQEHEETTS